MALSALDDKSVELVPDELAKVLGPSVADCADVEVVIEAKMS